jgi:hypothetical protein
MNPLFDRVSDVFVPPLFATSFVATAQVSTILQTLGWANGYENVNVVGTAQPIGDNGSAGGFAGIWNGLDTVLLR